MKETKSKKLNWAAIIGWAAAVIFMGGILWMIKQTNDLNKSLQQATTKNIVLGEEKAQLESKLINNTTLLELLETNNYQVFTLPGNQAVAPKASAKVYLNTKENTLYIDLKTLETPPSGKVYQFWALQMDPLVPTSIGLITDESKISEGIYMFKDFPALEAFGITLEPKSGSETPNLSQLYTLGMIPTKN